LNTLIVVLFFVVGVAAIIIMPRFLLRRAVREVVRIFRKQNATTPLTARTIEELKLQRKGFLQKMWGRRDYKPYALDALVRTGIVKTTEAKKLFLSEEELAISPLGKLVEPPRPY